MRLANRRSGSQGRLANTKIEASRNISLITGVRRALSSWSREKSQGFRRK